MNKNTTNIQITQYDIPIKDIYLKEKITTKNVNNQKSTKSPKKKNIKNKINKILSIIIIITLIIASSYNIFKIINWTKDNKKTKETITKLESTKILEVEDNENTENINEPTDQNSDYWYYITFPLINVNFNELIKKNTDTVAWINVNNTNINYPIVQTDNNDYYLNHSYDKSENEAGWLFLDYRNENTLTNKNNIVYGHSRLDKTMFGSLSKTLKESWYTDKSNHIIRISTPEEDTLWQIFSVYITEEETYYITTNFNDNTEYQTFLNTIRNRSKHNFNTELNENDKILTLSTCYSDTERTVVHAKLLKKSTR